MSIKKVINPEKSGNLPKSSNFQDENNCDKLFYQQQEHLKALVGDDQRTDSADSQITKLQLENSCPVVGDMQSTDDETTCLYKLLAEARVEAELLKHTAKDESNNRMDETQEKYSTSLFPSECIFGSTSEGLHPVPGSDIYTDLIIKLNSCNHSRQFENADTCEKNTDMPDEDFNKHLFGVGYVSRMSLNSLRTDIQVDSSVTNCKLGDFSDQGQESEEVPDESIVSSCLKEECEAVIRLCCNHNRSCYEGSKIGSPKKDAEAVICSRDRDLDDEDGCAFSSHNGEHSQTLSAANDTLFSTEKNMKQLQRTILPSDQHFHKGLAKPSTSDNDLLIDLDSSADNIISRQNRFETLDHYPSMDNNTHDDVQNHESNSHSMNNAANPIDEPVTSNTSGLFIEEYADNRQMIDVGIDVDVSLAFDFLGDSDRGGSLRQRRRKRREKNGQRKMKKDLSEEKTDTYEPCLVDFPEEHQCPVCFDLYCEPHACYPCDHVLCEACLRRLGQNNINATQCPMCRQLIMECIRKDDLRQTLKEIYPKEYRARLREQKKYLNNRFSPLPQSKTAFSRSPEDIRNIILGNRYHRNLPQPRVKLILTGFLILVCFVPAVSLGKAVMDSAVSLVQDLMTWL